MNTRRFLLVLGILTPIAARANPYVINPSSMIAFGVVSFFALVVEAGLVTLLLTFAGVAPVKMFFGFLFANIAVFLFIFWPLQQHLPLPALEGLIVVIDATSIWLLSKMPTFQGDSFRGVGWLLACITSLVGNATSYFIGVMASGTPWKVHDAGE